MREEASPASRRPLSALSSASRRGASSIPITMSTMTELSRVSILLASQHCESRALLHGEARALLHGGSRALLHEHHSRSTSTGGFGRMRGLRMSSCACEESRESERARGAAAEMRGTQAELWLCSKVRFESALVCVGGDTEGACTLTCAGIE